jgi:hypothetical protein
LQIGDRHQLRQRLRLSIDVGCARRGREAKNRLRHFDEVRIGEDAVFVRDRRRNPLEIESKLNADVLCALIALELLFDVIGCRGLDRARRR